MSNHGKNSAQLSVNRIWKESELLQMRLQMRKTIHQMQCWDKISSLYSFICSFILNKISLHFPTVSKGEQALKEEMAIIKCFDLETDEGSSDLWFTAL